VKGRIAFSFVLEALDPLSPVVTPMFGCHSIYVGDKIVLFLRDADKEPAMNGVWVATTAEGYESLLKAFASMAPFNKPKPGKSPWFKLSSKAPDFEDAALEVCEMILGGDPRIGRVIKRRKLQPEKQKPAVRK